MRTLRSRNFAHTRGLIHARRPHASRLALAGSCRRRLAAPAWPIWPSSASSRLVGFPAEHPAVSWPDRSVRQNSSGDRATSPGRVPHHGSRRGRRAAKHAAPGKLRAVKAGTADDSFPPPAAAGGYRARDAWPGGGVVITRQKLTVWSSPTQRRLRSGQSPSWRSRTSSGWRPQSLRQTRPEGRFFRLGAAGAGTDDPLAPERSASPAQV